MVIAQSRLARRFAAGEEVESLPAASNVTATTVDGTDVLVGYGWAIYAARIEGTVVLFEGWRGYSMSTTCQMTELRKGFHAALDDGFEVSDEAPSMGSLPKTTQLVGTTPSR